MSDTERIYSLYVQVNPVPDPDLLPLTQDELEPVIVALERSRAIDQEREEVTRFRRPSRSRIAALAFAAVVVVGAVVGVGIALTDDVTLFGAGGTPTLSFDGTAASYDGPTTFDDNTITFRLENGDTDRIYYEWNVMNDESRTLDEGIAWTETHRGPTYEIPPWVEDYGPIGTTVLPDQPVEVTVEIPDGKGMLYAWDRFNRILYPAALIRVGGGS